MTSPLPRPAPPRILVVDDEKGIVQMLRTLLTRQGYEVHGASSGPEALRRSQEMAFSLVLLDIRLGDWSGLEVCRQLRAMPAFRDVPVAFLTGDTDESLRGKSVAAGGSCFVEKPFHISTLLAHIQNLLEG